MSAMTSESRLPLGESQAAERRDRLVRLGLMVFELIGERYLGGTNHEFDGVEDSDLIAALRACSYYVDQIGCLDFGDALVVQIKSIDGHDYMLQFSLFDSGHSVHASRVRINRLPLIAGPAGRIESTYNTMYILNEHSKGLKFGKMTSDRAFLLGMSMVLSLMDDEADDPDEDARLAPLSALVAPTAEELREIWAKKLPPSTINYDDEVDMPY